MRRLAMDRRGAAAMIVAIVMPVLLLVMAMALDLSRVYIVKQRLQTSVDAAVSIISQEGTTADPLTTGIETDATNLFWNNFGSPQGQKKTGPLGATVPSSLTIGPYDSTIQKVPVSATASVPLVFGGLLHRGSMSVSALGYAAFSSSTTNGQWDTYFVAAGWSGMNIGSANQSLVVGGPLKQTTQNAPGYGQNNMNNQQQITNFVNVQGDVTFSQQGTNNNLLIYQNLTLSSGSLDVEIPINVSSGTNFGNNTNLVVGSSGYLATQGLSLGVNSTVAVDGGTIDTKNTAFSIGSGGVVTIENGGSIVSAGGGYTSSAINILKFGNTVSGSYNEFEFPFYGQGTTISSVENFSMGDSLILTSNSFTGIRWVQNTDGTYSLQGNNNNNFYTIIASFQIASPYILQNMGYNLNQVYSGTSTVTIKIPW